jgi:hypothetical protein
MKYQVKCMHTDEVLFEGFSRFECRGCESEGEEQHDAHGISTGYWCHECYESSKYPYRKDRYETIETHGYGERLSDDY